MRTMPPAARFATRASGIHGSAIDNSTSLLQRQSHDIVRFAMGSPAPDAVPVGDFHRLSRRVLGGGDASAFDYGPTEGEEALRTELTRFLEAQEGNSPPGDRLLITAGGMQGLDLACKLFVGPADLVVTEAPTYTNGTATITGYEGSVLEVPTDDEGMRVELLRELVERRGVVPKMIYTIPNFQNPSGTTLSLPRRQTMVELAKEWGAVVLEDDPYALLRFRGEPLPSLEALAEDDVCVVGVRTFSKMLAPGLRVGWVTAQPQVIEKMISAKQSVDTCANVPMQRLVAAFLAEGLLDAHLDRIRGVYRERKVSMQAGLKRHFGEVDDVRWTDPDGGFFLWLELDQGTSTEELFPVALEEGVAFIPGPAFSTEPGLERALRLCFATQDAERTDQGLARLRRAYERLKNQPKGVQVEDPA